MFSAFSRGHVLPVAGVAFGTSKPDAVEAILLQHVILSASKPDRPTWRLADFGARVIKLQPKGAGDIVAALRDQGVIGGPSSA